MIQIQVYYQRVAPAGVWHIESAAVRAPGSHRPGGHRGPAAQGHVGGATLDHIIANRFYIGYVLHRGQEFEAQHDCLVQRDLWERAQHQSNGKVGRRPEVAHYLFRGKVITDQLVITAPKDQAGKPVPLVPYFSKSKNRRYPSYYRADRRRKYGGLKTEVVDREATQWLTSSVPANELDEAVIESLAQIADRDQRRVLLSRAENAAQRMRGEMLENKAAREKELADVRRKLKKLVDITVGQGLTASRELVERWNAQLADLNLKEQILIGQVQACDDIVYRLDQAALEAEATLDQVNCIREFYRDGDIHRLREIIDLLVDRVIVRASEKHYELRVRLNPLPVVREVFETIPNRKEAAPTGVEPVPPP